MPHKTGVLVVFPSCSRGHVGGNARDYIMRLLQLATSPQQCGATLTPTQAMYIVDNGESNLVSTVLHR